MAFIPNSNSVVAFQSDPTKLVGTMSVVGLNFGNSSVILAPTSVAVLQGTNPWIVNVPSPSTIAYQLAGSVMAISGSFSATPQGSITAIQLAGSIQAVNMPSPSVIAYQLAGSIMAVNATVNTGNSSVQLLNGVAAIGSVAVLQGTNPWQVNVPTPSYIAYQLAGSVMAVAATVNTGNSSVQLLVGSAVIGSVAALQSGTWNISQVSGANVNQWNGNTVTTNTGPSTVGTLRVVVVTDQSSITVAPNPASVLAFQGTLPWVMQSIVGTFADNTAFTNNDKGLGILGVRNDTVASIINADKQYGQVTFDSAGRMLIKPFAPNEASIFSHTSVVNGGDSGSVVVLAAAGAGLRNYITDWTISNTGSVATLVTFTEGGGSILGRTIAPAGGGSNMPGMSSPMRNNLANQPINMVTATASSVVYVAVYGHKAP